MADFSSGENTRTDPGNGNPYWNQTGNVNDAKSHAYEAFLKIFKRAPSDDELAQVLPAYVGSDPNITNVAAGDALVAQMHQADINSPENTAKRDQEKWLTEAPKYGAQIDEWISQSLNRPATKEEALHFGVLMAQGVDGYTIKQFIDTLPEAVRRQDEKFRTDLGTSLQKQDSKYYSEQILPALQQQAARQGRSLDSSGVQNSLSLAAQQQNRQREGFLSGLTAQQYQGSQGLAQSAYQNAYGSYQNLQDYSRQRRDSMLDAITGRSNAYSDYNMQKQAYDQYLQRYGKRSNGVGGALGGASSGAMIGSAFGPWGTGIGAIAGGIGGYFGSQGGY